MVKRAIYSCERLAWCLSEGMESWLEEVKEKRHMPPEVVGEAECNLVAATGAIEASSDDTRLTRCAKTALYWPTGSRLHAHLSTFRKVS